MNSRFEAQRALSESLQDVHEALALSALQGIDIEVSSWAEVSEQQNPVVEAIVAYKRTSMHDDAPDWWQLNDVLYDDYGTNGARYTVPIMGVDSISLLESSTPHGLYGVKTRGRHGDMLQELSNVCQTVKYIDLHLHQSSGKKNKATVLIGPDMPASALYGDDIDYVTAINLDLSADGHHEIGPGIISLVEQAFGEEAVVSLPPEACIALSGAIRTAKAELGGYKNKHLHLSHL